jgi:thiol-disulfide isomerase/thioredoxin
MTEKFESYSNPSLINTLKEFKVIIIAGVGLLSVLGLVGVYLLINRNSGPENYTFEPDLVREENIDSGNYENNLRVVYFTDFQCPACKSFHPIFNQTKSDYNDRVEFVYKHNPLDIHPFADEAAYSVQAMALQDEEKAIDYIDLIFENQEDLSNSNLESWASQLDIDQDKWKQDRGSSEIKNIVRTDLEDLKQAEFPSNERQPEGKPEGETTGTPTVLIMRDEEILDWWEGGETKSEFEEKLNSYLNN